MNKFRLDFVHTLMVGEHSYWLCRISFCSKQRISDLHRGGNTLNSTEFNVIHETMQLTVQLPGKPGANNYGPLSRNDGLLWGILAYCGLLVFLAEHYSRSQKVGI